MWYNAILEIFRVINETGTENNLTFKNKNKKLELKVNSKFFENRFFNLYFNLKKKREFTFTTNSRYTNL